MSRFFSVESLQRGIIMSSMGRKFTPRILVVNGFSIFVGPCDSCPNAIEPWIKQFCSIPEHKWYVEIKKDWALDWFNHCTLVNLFPNFAHALQFIGDIHSKDWSTFSDDNISNLLSQAKQIYGLLHARWICEPQGLDQMKVKYKSGIFGTCPRIGCEDQHLIPMGTSAKLQRHSAKLFCPKCCDIYNAPAHLRLDGAHFGPAFPHIFFESFPELDARQQFQIVKLRAFGFPIHKSKKTFEPHSTNLHEEEYPTVKK